jgi:hypothetical protein
LREFSDGFNEQIHLLKEQLETADNARRTLQAAVSDERAARKSAERALRDANDRADRAEAALSLLEQEQEEAAQPEGSLRDLASVLTEDAHYDKNGSAGAGLYAKAQVAEQFRQPVDDLAKHIGVSIRAAGKAKEGFGPDGKKGRIIEQLTHGTSVDYVTTPGAGGKVLQLFEAARGTQTSTEGENMDLKQLQEANRNISKRLAKAEAREVAEAKLKPIRLPEASKLAIVERALADVPITETGDFDKTKFDPMLEAEIQYAASFIPGGAQVVGQGTAVVDPKVKEAQAAAGKKDRKRLLNESAERMGIHTKEGKRIFREGRAAFNPQFNAADNKREPVGVEG